MTQVLLFDRRLCRAQRADLSKLLFFRSIPNLLLIHRVLVFLKAETLVVEGGWGGGRQTKKKRRGFEKNKISVQIPKIWLRGDGGWGVSTDKKNQDQNPSFEKTQTPYGLEYFIRCPLQNVRFCILVFFAIFQKLTYFFIKN